jgi:hypothetical protein
MMKLTQEQFETLNRQACDKSDEFLKGYALALEEVAEGMAGESEQFRIMASCVSDYISDRNARKA